MELPAQTFEDITPEKFDAICARVKAKYEIDVTAMEGKSSKSGFTLTWDYSPSAQTLVIQCLSKPWLISSARVFETIANLVEMA